ncbi:hypothetical protein [Salinibacterium sp. M195]|uniref:hypothetical protein n=1 Tax=Salinibacterium sp. M195 TaxID=2583374 RepID=UPI001C62C2E7|nr:hypothetical protein [Salinibacterium sp. M195]QYH34724.1 hypothetical protein FFT87_01505 [Salinibacterium sp. M195]
MNDYEDPIPVASRGRLHAAVRKPAKTLPGYALKFGFAAVGSAVFAIILIGYLVQPTSNLNSSNSELWLITVALFLPPGGFIAYLVARSRTASTYELREGGVLVSPNVFVLWDEIASVNFEGRFSTDRSLDLTSKPFMVREKMARSPHDDLALGFVLRDFDAVIQRGPHEETINLVDPYGNTPGQAVVNFTDRIEQAEYIRLLQITDTVLAARGIPFRTESSTTRRLESQEYTKHRASLEASDGEPTA